MNDRMATAVEAGHLAVARELGRFGFFAEVRAPGSGRAHWVKRDLPGALERERHCPALP
jgi:hypothetical protein